ncbi:MAG: hypothetical protein JWN00_2606 [Actinomycetia bacterium]|nr:hypothetical protein [Actinomycetes bacterium]
MPGRHDLPGRGAPSWRLGQNGGAGPRPLMAEAGPGVHQVVAGMYSGRVLDDQAVPRFRSVITPTSTPPASCRPGHPLAKATAAARSSAVISE